MGAAHSCRIATTDSNSNRNAKHLPPRLAASANISTAVNKPPSVAPEKRHRAFLSRNSFKKRFWRKSTQTNTMNASAQPPAPANSPQQRPGEGIIIDLISDDEDDEYADAHEQVVAHQPHIDLDQYDFTANDDFEIVRDIPIHPPPPAANPGPEIRENPPFRRRSIFDEYGYDGEVEVLPNNPNLGAELPVGRPNLRAGSNDIFGDYVFDDEMDEEILAQAIIELEDYDIQRAIRPGPALAPRRASNPDPDFPPETKDECINKVLEVFGDICQDHVSGLYDKVSKSSERMLAYIVDKIEKGESYPKAKVLKRKRQFSEYEEAAQKYATADRIIPPAYAETRQLIRKIMQTEFSDIPMSYIDEVLNQEGYRLFTAYLSLEKAQRTYDPRQLTYSKLKSSRKMGDEFKEAKVEELIRTIEDEAKKDVYRELQAVRRTRQKDDAERQAKHSAALDEEENVRRAIEEGTMLECGCCCDDFPLNRMIHCDNENSEEMHWFCRGCALKTAEEEAGSGKYELFCMSMNRCTAGFSRDQRAIFLTESITKVLDGNEQETNLRLAGIVNLARCYACSFAAECPPIELDFEFRCPNPECREVTCRRCKEKSHTPKTCEEAKENKGLSLHHLVAESMSEGVIRRCNKCTSPFIKEEGCNKMTCTRCGNMQCYVCSQNCQYDHFNDTTRGGKQGNCPLFDNSDERHANDRDKAKKERIAAIRSEHPEYTEEELDIKMSEEVQKDDQKRRSNNPRAQMEARMGELRARQVALGGAREGLRAGAVPDFEEMRPMPMAAPRRPLIRQIRRRATRPLVFPEPPLLHPNHHIYRGQALPDFLDLPPPPPEQDFGDAAFEDVFRGPLFSGERLPAHMRFDNYYAFPPPAPVDPAAQPANQPGVQGIVPFPAVPRPQQYGPFDLVAGEAAFRRPLRPGLPVVPGVGGLPNAEPAPLIAAAPPQPPFPGNQMRGAMDPGLTRILLQQERAIRGLELLPDAAANAHDQFFRNFAEPEPWMRRQNHAAAAPARQQVQVEGAQNGGGNPGSGGANDEHALLRERQQQIIDRVNEQYADVRDRQREIIAETERRIQRRAERERLMREDEDGEDVIERAIAGIRQHGDIPDGLREVEDELRGMDELWQWR